MPAIPLEGANASPEENRLTPQRSKKPDRGGKGARNNPVKGRPQPEESNKTIPLTVPEESRGAPHRNGKLVVLSGSLQGREVILEKDACSIGSGPANDLVIDDSTVSRRHCEICFTPKGCLIRDLGSTNGTFLYGVKVSEAFLDHGAEFRLGKTSLVFRSLKDAGAQAPGPGHRFGRRFDMSLAIQKYSSRGIGYSVADWSDVRHVFAAAVPRRGTTLAEQADDALRIIETVNSVHGTHGTIAHQSVFVPDPALIDECRQIIREFTHQPRRKRAVQPPVDGLFAVGIRGGEPPALFLVPLPARHDKGANVSRADEREQKMPLRV